MPIEEVPLFTGGAELLGVNGVSVGGEQVVGLEGDYGLEIKVHAGLRDV
jgi:hypothetical protein